MERREPGSWGRAGLVVPRTAVVVATVCGRVSVLSTGWCATLKAIRLLVVCAASCAARSGLCSRWGRSPKAVLPLTLAETPLDLNMSSPRTIWASPSA